MLMTKIVAKHIKKLQLQLYQNKVDFLLPPIRSFNVNLQNFCLNTSYDSRVITVHVDIKFD